MKWNWKAARTWVAKFSAVALAISMSIPAAHAAKIGDEYAIAVVQVGDLELNEERDVARLLSRVKRAAREVCTPAGVASRYSIKGQRQCYEATLRKAMTDVEQIVDLPVKPTLASDGG
jgi:UrcA family protein